MAVLLLLFLLLSSAGSLPRVSFLLNSGSRPLVHFSLPDVRNTTTLLLSDDGSTLYVGAQNAILSLDVSQSDVIRVKRKVQWSPSQIDIKACQDKGKNPVVDCGNFVRVLQLINSTHLYVCGTFAFSPRNAFIDAESFSLVDEGGAKGFCPFDPFQRNVGVAIDGELFTATTSSFRGEQAQISRHFSRDGRPDVSQDSSVSLLQEPTFISSSLDPMEKKLYFFFSEVGKEFSFVDELQVARVAQVCKDDVGGQRTLQKRWTSFTKAPLLCHFPKQLPFNVLQDVSTLPQDDHFLFYAIFTSQWSSGPPSAVCVYRLQDIRTAFTGSYRTHWSSLLGKHSYLGQCGLDRASDSDLEEVKRRFLTSSGVKPVTGGPVLVSTEDRFSRVAAMKTTAANGRQYVLLFLLTESGFLHKVVFLDFGPWLIEEIQVFAQPQLVQSLVLSTTKGVLYVGTSEGVTKVPVAQCSVYTTCGQCVQSRDPLCGWSLSRSVCTTLHNPSDPLVQDLENGNVEKGCRQPTRTEEETEVFVHLNEGVRLKCLKPSNLATLTWTSSRFKALPQNLFLQFPDGTLSFLLSAATSGTYGCQAEEGGYKEVVARYRVTQKPSPRSMGQNVPDGEESHEDMVTENPELTAIRLSQDGEEFTTVSSTAHKEPSSEKNLLDVVFTEPFRKETQLQEEGKCNSHKLVVLTVLLVVCICVLMLGGFYVWRQRKVLANPLVSVDSGPELRVME